VGLITIELGTLRSNFLVSSVFQAQWAFESVCLRPVYSVALYIRMAVLVLCFQFGFLNSVPNHNLAFVKTGLFALLHPSRHLIYSLALL
jgi:hypothetical protein